MKYLLVLGNGFSIDLMRHLSTPHCAALSNIFAYGDRIPWPGYGGRCGFVSFNRTPHLWLLGVRPHNSSEKNNQVLESIITCANVYYTREKPNRADIGTGSLNETYLRAYKELVAYLKYLFVFLDSANTLEKRAIEDWSWARFFIELNEDTQISEVKIVTFNYDIWLERVLTLLNINFCLSEIDTSRTAKFSIVKPHGSISFAHKGDNKIPFQISYDSDPSEAEISQFHVKYDDLGTYSLVIPLIPPAGDSARLNSSWSSNLRLECKSVADSIAAEDNVILCGLSYWHVDRHEIDQILLSISPLANVAYINPNPSETLDAVLTSLFQKYEHFSNVAYYRSLK